MLSGGDFQDKGLYGCTFIPPLTCKPGTLQELDHDESLLSNPLGKIITANEAEIEFAISKMIHKIPLYKNYFAVSESICELSTKQKEKDLQHCPILKKLPLSDFRMLTIPYAGTTLSNKSFQFDTFEFMPFVINLISAGALLNLFGVVHRDLHQDNILVDQYNVPRIIDFNLSIPVRLPDLDDSMLAHTYEYSIAQEPPDSTLVNAISRGLKADHVIHTICFRKPILKKISTLLGIPHNDMYLSLYNFYRKSKSVKNGDLLKWFRLYYRTIDSWAIGINIISLITKFMLWKPFQPILKKYKSILFPLLKRMCSVNPIERIDCVQALHYLDPHHFIIRKYATGWLSVVGNGNIH